MSFNVGVNVVEVDGSAAPSITGAAVSVGAFNILTRRGVPNRPARITSFPQFVERFGRHYTGGSGAYLVKGFFDNGGQTAYINRVVDLTPGTGATPAERTFNDAAAVAAVTLRAGYRGEDDPGIWGRGTFVRFTDSSSTQTRLGEAAPAVITSGVIAVPVDMQTAGFPPLSVEVDGGAPTTLNFVATDFGNPAAATLDEIRDAINAQTNLLTAAVVANTIQLTSTAERASLMDVFSSLRVTLTNATLAFTQSATPTFATPVALAAGGTTLGRLGDLAVGDRVQVADGTTTETAKLLTLDSTTGAVTWAPPLANPAVYVALDVRISNLEFDLSIATDIGDDEHVVETFTGLSMEPDVAAYAPAVLNSSLRGSRFVRAIDVGTPGGDRPAPTAGFVDLQGGQEGTPTANHFIGDAAGHTGFFAFDPYGVQLVTCERTDTAIALGGLAYCQGRGDAMYIGAVPDGFVEGGQAIAYGQGLQAQKSYGALFGPWVVVADPIGVGDAPRVSIPPVGHVMGVFARIETTRGIWKAPAGDEANLLGVIDVTHDLSDRDHTDLVLNGSVNGIRAIRGTGIVIDASRTLSTDPRWRYVNVRLLFNYVKSSLRDGLRWVRQEPNRDFLWNAVKFGSVTPFLMAMWRQGAFGTGTPDETFTVIVDASNNTPAQVEQGRLTVEVYFYPSRPAETIVIIVGQQPSGATASEA
jgi:hypothetical protein